MQVGPQLASPQRLHRREAAVSAAPCPRALRYPHAEGRRDFPGKAAQSQRSMGYRLLSLYGGGGAGAGNVETTKKGGTNWSQTIFSQAPSDPSAD